MTKNPSGCLKGFAECLKNTSHMCTSGDEIIEVIELASDNAAKKAILNSIKAIMKISAKALINLSNSCFNRAIEIEKEHQEKLKRLGLINDDASIPGIVSEVVKETVVISSK